MGDLQAVDSSFLSSVRPLATLIKGHRIQLEQTKSLPTFYRNLKKTLNIKRASDNFYSTLSVSSLNASFVDFCSEDVMLMGWSSQHCKEFLAELERHPHFILGTTSSRLMDGNYTYIEQAESEIAAFHGAEAGLLIDSGFKTNLAI